MPGYAYQWLTPEKKKFARLEICYTTKYISVNIAGYTSTCIDYFDRDGNTEVKVEDKEKNMMIANRTFLDVCFEDLTLFWKNRDKKEILAFKCVTQEESSASIHRQEVIRERLFGFVENLLKTETKPPKVSTLEIDTSDIEQAVSMIQSLHPKMLCAILLNFTRREDPRVDIGELFKLKDWNRGRRLIVNVELQVLTSANLVTLQNLEQCKSTFFYFNVDFYSKDEDCDLEMLPDFLTLENNPTLEKSGITVNYNKWPCLDIEEQSDDSDEEIEQVEEQNIPDWLTILANRDFIEVITQELNYFNIQCLGKTCRDIRECVNIVNADPRVSEYEFVINEAPGVYVEITFTNGKKSQGWANVQYNLNVYLKRQIKCMDVLEIISACSDGECEHVLNTFQTHLKSMGSLKVRTLKLGKLKENEIMKVLPFIDAEKIDIFHFWEYDQKEEHLDLDIADICKTGTWTKAKEVCLSETRISTPIQEIPIEHFIKFEIRLKTISSEDILYLKNKLPASRNFQKHKFLFSNIINYESLHSLIGEPYRNLNNVRKIWYFYFEGSDDYMHLVLDTRDSEEYGAPNIHLIVFTRVAKEDTPFF